MRASASEPAPARRPRPALLLTVLCVAQLSLVIDLVVVTVTLPSLRTDLGIAAADLHWVMTAYGLAYGGFMITAGRAGDVYGHRRVLLAGLAIFTGAAVAAGLAPVAGLLVAARVVQGIGAALVSPTALALLTTAFAEGGARNRALGIWGAATSGGATAAGLLGGVLTELVHWRAIFLVNVPISAAVLAGILLTVRAARPAGGARLDVPGAVLLTGAAVMLVAAVTRAASGIDVTAGLMAVAAVALLLVFRRVERRVANPLVRLSIFRNPYVRYGNLICVLIAAAPLVVMFFTTLYLQQVAGLSPMQTGLAFAPVTGCIVVISGQAGRLAARFGVRAMLAAGAATSALGLLALAVAATTSDGWAAAMPGLLLAGAGAGLTYAPSMMVSTTGVSDADQGLASGLLNTSHQLGAPLGLAVIVAISIAVTGAAGGAGQLSAGYLAALVLAALTLLAVLAVPRAQTPTRPAPVPA